MSDNAKNSKNNNNEDLIGQTFPDRKTTNVERGGNMVSRGGRHLHHRRSNSDNVESKRSQKVHGDVVTEFGRGTLIRRRKDGISVVQLRFGVAFVSSSKAPSLKLKIKKIPKYHTMDSRGGVESQRRINKMKNFLRIDRQLAKNIVRFKHKNSTARDPVRKAHVIHLTRGGYYVRTRLGPIQVGMPPETIKDSLSQGLTLPTNFVIPSERFDMENGLNLAEFEFPAYYNFFILRKKINLITTKEIAASIREIFQETLLGPEKIEFPKRFSEKCPKEAYPDLMKELSFFRINPFTRETLQIDQILQFTYFDENGIATLEKGVTVEARGDRYIFREKGKPVAAVCSSIFPHPPESFDGKNKMMERKHHPRASLVMRNPSVLLKKLSSPVNRGKRQSSVFVGGRRLSSGDCAPITGFKPPYFGITMLGNSHGFDQNGTTTGFVIWVNRRGIMVDPPPYSSRYLRLYGIAPTLIREVILTHCHADHDAGTFQKILEEHRVTLMTTPVIFQSFLRKYSAISGFSKNFLQKLFIFRPVTIGEPIPAHGGKLNFFYSLHSIPCLGLEVFFKGKSMVYSGDTLNHAPSIESLYEKGLISKERRKQLMNFPWDHDVILHECGVPPIHTPAETLKNLDAKIKKNLYVVHVAEKSLKPEWGLKVANVGPTNTIIMTSKVDASLKTIELLELIQGVEIFSSLGLQKSSELLQSAKRRTVSKDQCIVTEGDTSNSCFLIAMGFVSVVEDRGPVKLLMVCDTFGEFEAIFEKPHTATFRAITDVELVEFPGSTLGWVLRDSPTLEMMAKVSKVQEEDCWQAMQANTCFDSWSALKLRQLQSWMYKKVYKEGDDVWEAKQRAEISVLVAHGRFVYDNSDQIHPFERGAFIGEFPKLVDFADEEPKTDLTTTLRCIEPGYCFVLPKEGLQKFFEINPGAMLQFINRNFIE